MQARTQVIWEHNTAQSLFKIFIGAWFVYAGCWTLFGYVTSDNSSVAQIPLSLGLLAVGLVMTGGSVRDLLDQRRALGRSFRAIDRSELPAELAEALTISESGLNGNLRWRGVRVKDLVQVDGRTYAWNWRVPRGQLPSIVPAVAVTVSEPFVTTVQIGPNLPRYVEGRLATQLLTPVGSDAIAPACISWVGDAVAVSVATGHSSGIHADRRFGQLILASVPSERIDRLAPGTQTMVPPGHDRVPLGLEVIVGFAHGTTVLLATASSSRSARRQLLAAAERLRTLV